MTNAIGAAPRHTSSISVPTPATGANAWRPDPAGDDTSAVSRTIKRAALGLFAAACLAPAVGHATIVAASSSAFGESVSFTTAVGGILGASITSGPAPTVAGSAPAPYSNTNSAVSANLAVLIASSLSTGVLSVTASSTATGGLGARTTNATAAVNNLALGLVALLGLNATTVQSTAAVGGDFGGLTRTGTTTITGLMLNGNSVSAGSGPNTVLLDDSTLGVEVLLNEQIPGGNGVTSASLTVNAIDITLTDAVLGVDTLNGKIIIGQSVASETAVAPEPASLAVFGASLGGLALMKRRRIAQAG